MVGELPERVYVPQLNRTVAVFATKQNVPWGYGEEYAVIPEDGLNASDISNGQAVIEIREDTPAGLPLRPGIGWDYAAYSEGLPAPGAGPLGVIGAWLAMNFIRLIFVVGVLAILAYAVHLTFSTQVTKLDDTHYSIISPWGSGVYDTADDSYNKTDEGLSGMFDQIINGALMLLIIGGGAYIAFKVVLPAAANAMESGAGKAYRFAKREAKSAYEYGREQFR